MDQYAFSYFLSPARCVLCMSHTANMMDLCDYCAQHLPYNTISCQQCAQPLRTHSLLCGRCLRHPPAFEQAFAPFIYTHMMAFFLTQFKFNQNLSVGQLLIHLFLQSITPRTDFDMIIPVPLHQQRLRTRGFNQSGEFARILARHWRIPVDNHTLTRIIATPPQAKLSFQQRQRNLKKAFVVAKNVLDKKIILVDDVITTTATVNACAAVLKKAGAQAVCVVAIARTTGN